MIMHIIMLLKFKSWLKISNTYGKKTFLNQVKENYKNHLMNNHFIDIKFDKKTLKKKKKQLESLVVDVV